MGLTEQVKTRMIPDENGGWYWLKKGSKAKWEPVYVHPATDSWPASVDDYTGGTPVKSSPEHWIWGNEIIPPKD